MVMGKNKGVGGRNREMNYLCLWKLLSWQPLLLRRYINSSTPLPTRRLRLALEGSTLERKTTTVTNLSWGWARGSPPCSPSKLGSIFFSRPWPRTGNIHLQDGIHSLRHISWSRCGATFVCMGWKRGKVCYFFFFNLTTCNCVNT